MNQTKAYTIDMDNLPEIWCHDILIQWALTARWTMRQLNTVLDAQELRPIVLAYLATVTLDNCIACHMTTRELTEYASW